MSSSLHEICMPCSAFITWLCNHKKLVAQEQRLDNEAGFVTRVGDQQFPSCTVQAWVVEHCWFDSLKTAP